MIRRTEKQIISQKNTAAPNSLSSCELVEIFPSKIAQTKRGEKNPSDWTGFGQKTCAAGDYGLKQTIFSFKNLSQAKNIRTTTVAHECKNHVLAHQMFIIQPIIIHITLLHYMHLTEVFCLKWLKTSAFELKRFLKETLWFYMVCRFLCVYKSSAKSQSPKCRSELLSPRITRLLQLSSPPAQEHDMSPLMFNTTWHLCLDGNKTSELTGFVWILCKLSHMRNWTHNPGSVSVLL